MKAVLIHNRQDLAEKNFERQIDRAHHFNPKFQFDIDRGHYDKSPSIIHTDHEGLKWPRFFEHDINDDMEYYLKLHGAVYSGSPEIEIDACFLNSIINGIREFYSFISDDGIFRQFRNFTGIFEDADLFYLKGMACVIAAKWIDFNYGIDWIDNKKHTEADFIRVRKPPCEIWKTAFEGREYIDTEKLFGYTNPFQAILYGKIESDTFDNAAGCIKNAEFSRVYTEQRQGPQGENVPPVKELISKLVKDAVLSEEKEKKEELEQLKKKVQEYHEEFEQKPPEIKKLLSQLDEGIKYYKAGYDVIHNPTKSPVDIKLEMMQNSIDNVGRKVGELTIVKNAATEAPRERDGGTGEKVQPIAEVIELTLIENTISGMSWKNSDYDRLKELAYDFFPPGPHQEKAKALLSDMNYKMEECRSKLPPEERVYFVNCMSPDEWNQRRDKINAENDERSGGTEAPQEQDGGAGRIPKLTGAADVADDEYVITFKVFNIIYGWYRAFKKADKPEAPITDRRIRQILKDEDSKISGQIRKFKRTYLLKEYLAIKMNCYKMLKEDLLKRECDSTNSKCLKADCAFIRSLPVSFPYTRETFRIFLSKK